ncbi:MAG: hypothetical protein JSW71_06270, partial [Gemmatimonadota bacterium]
TGLSLGTPEYMSPEQATGGGKLDQRADIYSLGAVIYEMVTGEPPQTGATVQAVIAKLLSQPPVQPRVMRDSVPEALDRATMKALAKVPADRFESAADLVAALTAEAETEAEVNSIGVLPFANLSADPEQEYFSDGMTEEIINALAHLEDLHVASCTSSFAFKEKSPEIAEVGEKLKVATVLEGSVRRSGDRLRITAQLIKVADGYHLWSQRYDRRMGDVFDIQDEIAHAIVGALKVRLLGAEGTQLLKRGTHDLEAYHLYLKGRHLWLQRGEGMSKCISYFEQAIEKDPHYAQPHAGLADAYGVLAFYGFVDSQDARAKAQWAAERAVLLDDGLAEAHYSLGVNEWFFGWDMERAESEFRRAIGLDPCMAVARAWLSNVYAVLGRFPESAAEAKHAQELEPMSPLINSLAAGAHYTAGRRAQAREAAQRALEINPTIGFAHWVMGLVAVVESNYEDAVSAFENAASCTQQSPTMLLFLGSAYARCGREADARKILGELQEKRDPRAVSSAFAAQVNFDLGELDLAFEQLDRAFEERAPLAWSVISMPGYTWPRTDARLASLLERAQLKWLEPWIPQV